MGVIIDQALNFSEHIANKINKANRNLGIGFRPFTFMDKEVILKLYKTIVKPHLEYAVTVWLPLYKRKDTIAIARAIGKSTEKSH